MGALTLESPAATWRTVNSVNCWNTLARAISSQDDLEKDRKVQRLDVSLTPTTGMAIIRPRARGTTSGRDDIVRAAHITPMMKAQNQRVNGSGITQLHRTANINEMSGRYRLLPPESYVPTYDRIGGKGVSNKQGTEGDLNDVLKADIVDHLSGAQARDWTDYEWLAGTGLSNELARINLPVSAYTEWFWKIDLHNLFHFLKLRADSHAQWEIRQYATQMLSIVNCVAPVAYEAWEDFVYNAVTFSAQEMEVLRRVHLGDSFEDACHCVEFSDKEKNELDEKLACK